jgi:uncharacterized protein YkwD
MLSIGVLFSVAAPTKGGEGRDGGEGDGRDAPLILDAPKSKEAAVLSSEIDVLPSTASYDCSVNSIEPELKALFDLQQTTRGSGARCGSTKMRSTSSLRWSCELANAADIHVNDMAENDFMSHKGSDGSTIGQRATKANYIWRAVAENAAEGFEVPSDVHRVWLASPGHCKNIMNPAYSEMGAAKAGDYWVVMFGRR